MYSPCRFFTAVEIDAEVSVNNTCGDGEKYLKRVSLRCHCGNLEDTSGLKSREQEKTKGVEMSVEAGVAVT